MASLDPAASGQEFHSTHPQTRRRRKFVLGAVAALVLGTIGYWVWHDPHPPQVTPPKSTLPADDDIADPVVVNPGYIGPQVCAECHRKRYEEIHTSKHFHAAREPRADEMPAGFQTGKGIVRTRTPGFRFEMLKRGNDYIHASVRQTPAGEERTEAKIGMVYGSSPADEVYHVWRGDKLYETKVAWLHPFGEWGYSTFSPQAPGDHSRETTTRCVECHNTWLAHVPGTMNRYLEPNRILGVTCESCHGPGREHTEFHRENPGEKVARGIAHPGQMARERNIEVCTQCHSNTSKPRVPAFQYRPGEVLETAFRTATSQHPEEDHVANQIAYLRPSKCFTKSDSMTCTTCHDPHKPGDRETVAESCSKCHRPESCRDRPNLPVAVQNRCTACHMPPRVWMNVHFHTHDDEYKPPVKRYDHRIGVYPEAKNAVLLQWYRTQTDAASKGQIDKLKASLSEYWLGEAARRNRAYRFHAEIGALRELDSIDPTPALREKIRVAATRQAKIDADWSEANRSLDERRNDDAIRRLDALVAIKPDHAKAHGKLGRLYAELGQTEVAEKQLRSVAIHDPNDAYGLNLLGWIAFLAERHDVAIGYYRQAAEIEPYSTDLRARMGLAFLKLDRWAEATEAFRASIAIDPKNASAFQGLAHALRMQKQSAEAVRYARRAAQLTDRRNWDVLLTLADAYEDVGRIDDAIAAANDALELAIVANSRIEWTIRARIEKIEQAAKQRPAS